MISMKLEFVCRNAVKYRLSIKHNALEGQMHNFPETPFSSPQSLRPCLPTTNIEISGHKCQSKTDSEHLCWGNYYRCGGICPEVLWKHLKIKRGQSSRFKVWVYIGTCLLYLLCNMGPVTIHQPNKLLSYAQFCLHQRCGKFHFGHRSLETPKTS